MSMRCEVRMKKLTYPPAVTLLLCSIASGLEPPSSDGLQASDPAGQHDVLNDNPDEQNPAKRRAFISGLNRKRVNSGCFHHAELLQESPESIPETEKRDLLQKCSAVLPRLSPTNEQPVRWLADLANKDTNRQFLSWVVAEWTIGDLTLWASRSPGAKFIRILISMPPSRRVNVENIGAGETTRGKEELKLTEIQDRVRELLGRSHDAPDFMIRGEQVVSDGIAVFVGRLDRDKQVKVDGSEDSGSAGRSSITPSRILITDSDPQYLCLTFDLSQDAPVPEVP